MSCGPVEKTVLRSKRLDGWTAGTKGVFMNVHAIFKAHCEEVDARISAYEKMFKELCTKHDQELRDLQAEYNETINKMAEELYGPPPEKETNID
jgi:hypothetical protein